MNVLKTTWRVFLRRQQRQPCVGRLEKKVQKRPKNFHFHIYISLCGGFDYKAEEFVFLKEGITGFSMRIVRDAFKVTPYVTRVVAPQTHPFLSIIFSALDLLFVMYSVSGLILAIKKAKSIKRVCMAAEMTDVFKLGCDENNFCYFGKDFHSHLNIIFENSPNFDKDRHRNVNFQSTATLHTPIEDVKSEKPKASAEKILFGNQSDSKEGSMENKRNKPKASYYRSLLQILQHRLVFLLVILSAFFSIIFYLTHNLSVLLKYFLLQLPTPLSSLGDVTSDLLHATTLADSSIQHLHYTACQDHLNDLLILQASLHSAGEAI